MISATQRLAFYAALPKQLFSSSFPTCCLVYRSVFTPTARQGACIILLEALAVGTLIFYAGQHSPDKPKQRCSAFPLSHRQCLTERTKVFERNDIWALTKARLPAFL